MSKRCPICPRCQSLDVQLDSIEDDGVHGVWCESCDLSPFTGPVDMAWSIAEAWEEWFKLEEEYTP